MVSLVFQSLWACSVLDANLVTIRVYNLLATLSLSLKDTTKEANRFNKRIHSSSVRRCFILVREQCGRSWNTTCMEHQSITWHHAYIFTHRANLTYIHTYWHVRGGSVWRTQRKPMWAQRKREIPHRQ